MAAWDSKIIENLITLLVKNRTLEVKKTRRSKQTEQWHGGGICAQRTGYEVFLEWLDDFHKSSTLSKSYG